MFFCVYPRYFDKFDNGSYVLYDANFTQNLYQTSNIGNATLNWLNSDHVVNSSKPFFVWWGPHAPHYSATPSAWYVLCINNINISL